MSFFDSCLQLSEDPIFSLPILFRADTNPKKVNLGIGAYQDAEGKSLVLSCVKKAEANLLSKERSKNYLPIDGIPGYNKAVSNLLFGNDLSVTLEGLFTAQAIGGTGALSLGGEFLAREITKNILIPSPTWANHKVIFERAGLNVHSYTYYDLNSHTVDFERMCADIKKAPPGSALLLHPCCHNPSGSDLNFDQWKEISHLAKQMNHIPFFDCAYQGFKDNIEDDVLPIRYFLKEGHELLVAQSFSKNFGLYGERVGAICIAAKHKEAAIKVGSQIRRIIRASYSNPPTHGAQIVADVFNSEELKKEWVIELGMIRNRIKAMRQAFYKRIQAQFPNRDWSFIARQHGFFSLLGLSGAETSQLSAKHGIYMPASGRINIAGLNLHNIDTVVDSIVDVISK